MTVKLILLKSGETLITDAKEFVFEDPETEKKEVCGYLFNKPHLVFVYGKSVLTEEESSFPVNLTEEIEERSSDEVQVTLSPWILLTNDEDITVPKDWIVTIVDPVSSIKQMYEEKVNGQSS